MGTERTWDRAGRIGEVEEGVSEGGGGAGDRAGGSVESFKYIKFSTLIYKWTLRYLIFTNIISKRESIINA